MNQLVKNYLPKMAAIALFSGTVFVMPTALQAKTNGDVTVDVTVNVHGSDIGVSTDVMEESVEKLLEAAKIHVVEQSADKEVVQLKIDIYKDDDGHGFKVDSNWDDDEEAEAEKTCETQDEIDDIVEEEVDAFIAFIHHG